MAKAPQHTPRRKWLWVCVGVLASLIVGYFAIIPGIVERSMNRIEGSGEWTVGAKAQALHDRLVVVDMHADTLLWKRDPAKRSSRGHVDLPRLREGNVTLQIFSSVTKSPKGLNDDYNDDDSDDITGLVIAQLQPPRTWDSLLQRSLYHSEKMHRAAEGGGYLMIRSRDDLDRLLTRRASSSNVTGALLSVEGLHNLEGRIDNLDMLFDAGFRMAGLTHFFDNELGGSAHGVMKGGLTPFGRQVVRRMEDIGMIVDLAHASPAVIDDVLKMARRPVVSSHGGVKATCDATRNLDDRQIRGIAANGGIIGIGYWDVAICDPTPQSAARAIRHVRDLVGIDHVGLGSDFDGTVTVGFDTAQLAAVSQALLDQGFSEVEIEKVMGGNVMRLLGAGLPQR